ncbi:MAG: YciI family protein [Alphaproteobacteria bacterium]
MQFLLIAYDATDEDALTRRLSAREAHLVHAEGQKARGELLYGGAILDAEGKMIGSCGVYEFPSKEALSDALSADPYVTGKVWNTITIQQYRLAPFFLHAESNA